MAESVGNGLVRAVDVARDVAARKAANGVAFGVFGEPAFPEMELERLVQGDSVGRGRGVAGEGVFFCSAGDAGREAWGGMRMR